MTNPMDSQPETAGKVGQDWTVGQHPAIADGWIVRPVLFGSRVRVLPESEGGHVILKSESDARLIAAAPDLLEALTELRWVGNDMAKRKAARAKADAAIAQATGADHG